MNAELEAELEEDGREALRQSEALHRAHIKNGGKSEGLADAFFAEAGQEKPATRELPNGDMEF